MIVTCNCDSVTNVASIYCLTVAIGLQIQNFCEMRFSLIFNFSDFQLFSDFLYINQISKDYIGTSYHKITPTPPHIHTHIQTQFVPPYPCPSLRPSLLCFNFINRGGGVIIGQVRLGQVHRPTIVFLPLLFKCWAEG